MKNPSDAPAPIQPVDRPILCSPWAEPTAYWQYDRDTGEAREIPGRRPAGYFYDPHRLQTPGRRGKRRS